MENRNLVMSIKNEYVAKEPTKLDELKKLDRKVKLAPSVFAYTFGSLSSLVLGSGMCYCLDVLEGATWLGYVLGILGLILMTLNPIIYKAWVKKNKKKYGNEILKLADELLNE